MMVKPDTTNDTQSVLESGGGIALEQTAAIFAGSRYRVRSVLGVGGQKIVYLVHDASLDRECALALINTDTYDAEDIVKLQDEARAVARLGSHNHIVAVYDIGEHESQPFVVSEYLSGGDLRRELVQAGGRLSVSRTLQLGEQVLRALSFVHTQKVVHRDLKPENIWLTADRTAKLGDFGLAKRASDHTSLIDPGEIAGTPAYMSPEQLQGAPLDGRCDLYAMGCVVFELVTGAPPFTGALVSVISQHLHKPPASAREINPNIPVDLDRLIGKLLAKDAQDRPRTAKAALEELTAISADASQGSMDVAPVDAGSISRFAYLPFVGRSGELDQLRAAWDQACRGDGRLVVITGEAGIGKSRLVRELGVHVRALRGQLLTGRCAETESAAPYLPFVEALEQALNDRDTAELQVALQSVAPLLERMLPKLAVRLGHVPPMVARGETPDRLAMFQSVAVLLQALTQAAPMLLVLEDLHWADKPSLLLLQHLVRQLPGLRLLMVVTCRVAELESDHPLALTLATMHREPAVEKVTLTGMAHDEVRQLLVSAGAADLPGASAQGLLEQTAGNPLFVEELLKDLTARDGPDELEPSGAGGTRRRTSAVPEGIKAVLERRLVRLGDACRQMLRTAAALEPSFRWDVLCAVSGADEDDLLDQLDEALRAQVVIERGTEGGGRFEFNHSLMKQALLAELSIPRRIRLHRRIGDVISELAGADDRHIAEIAHHYYEAAAGGGTAAAVEWCGRASDQSLAALAFEDAIVGYTRVLELTERDDDGAHSERRMEVFLNLSRALAAVGRWPDARAALDKALPLVREGDHPGRLWTLLSLAEADYWSFDNDALRAHVTDALALARSLGDSLGEATALALLGQMESSAGNLTEALRYGDEAISLAPDHHIAPLVTHSVMFYWQSRHTEAMQEAQRHVKLAQRVNRKPGEILSLSTQGMAEVGLGRYDDAIATFDRVCEIGEQYGILAYLARCLAIRAGMHNDLYDYKKARALAKEAREMGRLISFHPVIVSAGFDLMFGYIREGDLPSADEIALEQSGALEKVVGFHEWVWGMRMTAARAELHLARKEWEAAIRDADDTIARGLRHRQKYQIAGLITRGHALAGLGREADAGADLDAALALAREGVDPAVLLRALAARLTHAPDEALRSEAQRTIDQILAHLTEPSLRASFLAAPIVAELHNP